jgi:cardiolipin synthase
MPHGWTRISKKARALYCGLKHIPNLLSAARVVLAPWVIVLLLRGDFVSVLWWFLFAAITDALDGWLARRLRVESALGQMLDPVADKLLLSGVFVALAAIAAIPWWLALLVLGRDALILLFAAGALLFTKTRRRFPPSVWGKLSTIAQMGFVVAVVLDKAGFALPVAALGWVTAGVTVVSAVEYARSFLVRSSP